MSASSGPRACWPVLVLKARQACDAARSVWQAAHEQAQAAARHVAQLQRMWQEYHVRHHEQVRQVHAMGDHLNQRRFVAQLDELMLRAQHEQRRLERHSERCRSALIAAQLELDKMEKLHAHDLERHQAQTRQREQRRFDDLATSRHHWREH